MMRNLPIRQKRILENVDGGRIANRARKIKLPTSLDWVWLLNYICTFFADETIVFSSAADESNRLLKADSLFYVDDPTRP